MSYGLLVLRAVAGLTMSAHGAQKLFGWFGGPGLQGTAGMTRSLGFRLPTPMALLLALTETGAGLLFAIGFLTPLAAFGIVVVMLVAITLVHWKNGFFNGKGGYEFNLLILTTMVALAATGPGRFSLDRLAGWDDNISGLWWGVGVLVAGITAALVTLVAARERHVLRERTASS
jgi:putative oxidoreductase